MSDILADIDDTLADWHGSRDSMHWRPGLLPTDREPTPEEIQAAIERVNAAMVPVIRTWTAQFAAMAKIFNATVMPMARALGLIPAPAPRPSRLDARYRQRQKNRVKRRR